MPRWRVSEELGQAFGGVGRVIVRASGGTVTVRTAPGPVRLRVSDVRGRAVDVLQDGGVLRVAQPAPGFGTESVPADEGDRATMEITVSPDVEVDVAGDGAAIHFVEQAERPEVRTVARRRPREMASTGRTT